jgi:hypothetical protein
MAAAVQHKVAEEPHGIAQGIGLLLLNGLAQALQRSLRSLPVEGMTLLGHGISPPELVEEQRIRAILAAGIALPLRIDLML